MENREFTKKEQASILRWFQDVCEYTEMPDQDLILSWIMSLAVVCGELEVTSQGKLPNPHGMAFRIRRLVEEFVSHEVHNGWAKIRTVDALRRVIDEVRREKTIKFLEDYDLPVLDQKLTEEDFSDPDYPTGRIMRALREGNTLTLRDLIVQSEWQLREIRFMGRRTAIEINWWLEDKHGLYLGMTAGPLLKSWLHQHTT